MSFKYKDRLDAIRLVNSENCMESYSAKTIVPAYRFSFNTINDERNFLPMGTLHAGLVNRCGAWALSFHLTKEQSKDTWLYLTSDKPNKYKKLGTAIASGTIETTDGICCDPSECGHFDCHEFENTDFRTKFKVVEVLLNAD